jgi:GntR family transcriptional regulator
MQASLATFRQDLSANTPLYLQVANTLSSAIEDGVWQAAQALPAERQLADLLKVSRVTARKALEILCERGMLTRRRGSGNYVAPKVEQCLSRLSNFSDQLRERGFTPGSQWLSRETGIATPHEVLSLGLGTNAQVARLKRLRTADQVVMAIESTTVPIAHLPDPAAVADSLYDYLAAKGLQPVRALQRIAAVNATDEQARLAHIAPGEAMLFITRVSYPERGGAVELTHSYCLSRYYDFVAELRC